MSKKKAYPLRIDETILNALQSWADDELRSLNGQIEYVLREVLRKNGRIGKPANTEGLPDTQTD